MKKCFAFVVFTWIALMLTGCGSAAGFALRAPAVSKCESTSLKACDKLVDGIIAYADNKPGEAVPLIKSAISENMDSPDSVESFVNAMLLLKQAPGVGPYIATLDPAWKVMLEAAREAKKNGKSGAKSSPPKGSGGTASASNASSTARTKSLQIATSSKAKACKPWNQSRIDNTPAGEAKCVELAAGPYQVTDILSAGCPNMIMLMAGDVESPRWAVVLPPNQTTTITGAKLNVTADDSLFAVQWPASKDATVSPQCTLTWTTVE